MNTIKTLIATGPGADTPTRANRPGRPAAVGAQARNTALLPGDGVINVARRGPDGAWRHAISVLTGQQAPGHRSQRPFPEGTSS
jgi:hypothetical protein